MAQGGPGYNSYESIHDLITCPYNKAHKVGASRFPNHLVKCRKQYPELAKDMVICNFNQSHHILRKDMDAHLVTCQEYKAHLLHSINTCKPTYLPECLHKPLADSVNPKLKTRREEDEKFCSVFTKAEVDDWK